MEYGGMPAYCLAHKTLLLQRSGELGIPSWQPCFQRGMGSPWPALFNPLLSPTENDQIVQGKLVVCSCYILQPVPYIPSLFCTLGRRCHVAKDHCPHHHAVHLSDAIKIIAHLWEVSLQHASDSVISQLWVGPERDLSSSCKMTYSFIFHLLLINSTLFTPSGLLIFSKHTI